MGRILIIGAGFSGAVLAAQLMRLAGTEPLDLCLVNRSGPMARGLAYGTQSPEHTLNVPAGNMSAFPDQPGHFLRFARARDPALDAGSFVARRLYGDYLEAVLAEAIAGAAPTVRFTHLEGDVIRLERRADGALEAVFADGARRVSDQVVLAFGHFPARDPVLADSSFYASPRYLRDPWDAGRVAQIGADEPVLLLGSGLTAVDTLLSLLRRSATRRLVAVSRHGLLPQAHRAHPRQPAPSAGAAAVLNGAVTLRQQLRAFRDYSERLEAAGGDWRDALVALRPLTAALWQAWPEVERKRFLRHVQAYWDSHRHRLAPSAAARIEAARSAGLLEVHAGRLVALQEEGDHVGVVLRARGGDTLVRLAVGYVINCTGACGDPAAARSPLVAQLLETGLVRLDPLRLGLDLGPHGAALGHDGRPSDGLFYLGPWLRARDWEATAVPELRQCASSLAAHLLRLQSG